MVIMVKMMKDNKKRTTRVHDLFSIGQGYKNGSLNLDKEITRSINFVEGKQWTNADGTDDYPKIVLKQLLSPQGSMFHQISKAWQQLAVAVHDRRYSFS